MTGWLFDLYPSPRGITIWLMDNDGRKYRCTHPFVPSFYLHVDRAGAERAAKIVERFPFRVSFHADRRREIYTDEEWEVYRVDVHDTLHFKQVVQALERHFPHFVFFDSDIAVQQLFLYTSGLFPLAFGDYTLDEEGTLLRWDLRDVYDAMDYTLPPLVMMTLKNKPDFVSTKHRKSFQLEVTYDGSTYALEHHDPAEILHALERHLTRCDPDIIMTEHGDAILLPLLTRLSAEEKVPVSFNRDVSVGYNTSKASSYFSYGKIVHKEGAFELAGRWHLDLENSFMMSEASLDGVVEIARLTQLPVQHQSRATIGSALSSMQLSWAERHGYLIPAKKREPEEFKTASTLLLADRGGVIFQPLLGFHEEVAELDFVSMYPTIMVEHNVSPETVNCRCCHNARVPELGYTICERREGIVPATLRTVVRRRGIYKKKKKALKAANDPSWMLFDRRQNALKWMLVTCFGYLGYKNARFGRIEAHETVNAFSRDAILHAKEAAEAQGYQFIHAIVDCMWIKKPGATQADYERLAVQISEEVGIDLSLEGIYSWILFPSSKIDPLLPTANRYVGWYKNNEIKIRGIEVRRRDTPVFIKRMQGELLKLMGEAKSVSGIETMVPLLVAKAGEFVGTLLKGRADPLELVIHCHLLREPEEYTTNTVNASAAKALAEAGIHLAAGEMVDYVVVDATGKRRPEKARPMALYALEDGYDIEFYTKLALKAIETLLLPFGYPVSRLAQIFHVNAGKPERGRKRTDTGQLSLFELHDSITQKIAFDKEQFAP
ncbi:MAG: DNA polymerase domain-containing protein [Bacteroidota bacterium]